MSNTDFIYLSFHDCGQPTVIFSSGYLEVFLSLLESAAYIRVSAPTLPRNISIIRIILETAPRAGVIPRVSPTVPTADAVSNRHSPIGRPSIRLIAAPPARKNETYIINTAAAFFVTDWSILLPKK